MKKEKKSELKKLFGKLCKIYVDIFCKKHELQFSGWVANNPGTAATCSDYYINFDDIRYDIDNDIPEDKFTIWYDLGMNGNRINYDAFCRNNYKSNI